MARTCRQLAKYRLGHRPQRLLQCLKASQAFICDPPNARLRMNACTVMARDLTQELLARDRQEICCVCRPPGPRLGTALACRGAATRDDELVSSPWNSISTSESDDRP